MTLSAATGTAELSPPKRGRQAFVLCFFVRVDTNAGEGVAFDAAWHGAQSLGVHHTHCKHVTRAMACDDTLL